MRRDWIYYLASPFSTPTVEGRAIAELKAERHHQVQFIGHQLYELGFILIEPIASSYHKALAFGAPGTYEYWKERDRKLVKASDALMVATLDGWEDSVGVTDEISYAQELGKPVFLITVDESMNVWRIQESS